MNMHFIDKDEVEIRLPDNWQEKVDVVWQYINGKTAEVEVDVRAKAVEEIWDNDKLEHELKSAILNARKKAINSKSDVWGTMSQILSGLSFGKCWYCESTELRSDNPVDHFRPKGKVAECPEHPGYWWLAFEWSNFRYSCTYCNSRRVDTETSGGKQDHFPILPPPMWNKSRDDVFIENPVLLDPTDIDDVNLLTFNINGEACPNVDDNSSPLYRRAKESVELYHLNHVPTKNARKRICQKVRMLVSNINRLSVQNFEENKLTIKDLKIQLHKMIRVSCPRLLSIQPLEYTLENFIIPMFGLKICWIG
ncbi:hypothetical protein GTU79_24665 [Sodalis ligni]|uniref:hypothetical protein n=1 Tax=Sodalis ligni TaxID=2697027 RepID=UPI001BDE6613|nr:hypothetical protein [Sodalis ligni]QWA10375.1 hypothetical protein GTU79_24665 [Sodalis ligni]